MSKPNKTMRALGWIMGSVAVFAAAVYVIPPLITKASSSFYRAINRTISEEELFPDPVIVKNCTTLDTEEENEYV